ncbi:unnamed protein product [Heterotrigona itama]|uniref:Uncharacterized protein n=1 Tax=Heterotrigona itama TaxID=395501 RepID=A0A6V7HF95_9HYME|nr:unnamed protein product [Heterotrigona itama]
MCKGGVFESEARVNEKRRTRGMCAYRLVQSCRSIERKGMIKNTYTILRKEIHETKNVTKQKEFCTIPHLPTGRLTHVSETTSTPLQEGREKEQER